MYVSEQLQKKWGPILEHPDLGKIKDPYKRAVTTILLENQEKETLSLPLRGIKILSIEQYVAAPFGSMFLADLGAEVIKIENPDVGGEMGRHVVPYSKENDSLFFQSFSANKKSMGLNLQSDKGKKVYL